MTLVSHTISRLHDKTLMMSEGSSPKYLVCLLFWLKGKFEPEGVVVRLLQLLTRLIIQAACSWLDKFWHSSKLGTCASVLQQSVHVFLEARHRSSFKQKLTSGSQRAGFSSCATLLLFGLHSNVDVMNAFSFNMPYMVECVVAVHWQACSC